MRRVGLAHFGKFSAKRFQLESISSDAFSDSGDASGDATGLKRPSCESFVSSGFFE